MLYGQHFQQSMDQPGTGANPARGQLNRENIFFHVHVRAWEFGLARRVRAYRPTPAPLFSPHSLRLNNMVLAHGIDSSRFPRRRVHIYIHRQPPSGQSRVNRVITQLITDGVHCRESIGTGPLILKVVRVLTGTVFSGFTMNQFLCSSLSHTHYDMLAWSGHVCGTPS